MRSAIELGPVEAGEEAGSDISCPMANYSAALNLINTLLQRGGRYPNAMRNRFNGLHITRETVETVSVVQLPSDTPLKQGVNESTLPAFRGVVKYSGSTGSQRGTNPGFTLLELLVVVAIIVMLAAMLLPSLIHSKDQAKRIVCANNLRQLSLATHLYWDDNANNCFRYNGGLTNYGQLYWFGWLGPGTEGERAFDISQGVLFPYLKGRGVELCPSLNYLLAQFKLKATGASYGYGYNRLLSGTNNSPPIKAGQILHPADLCLFADAAQINTWQAPASPQNPMIEEWYYVDSTPDPPNGHFRHGRKANVGFCDAHVALENPVPGSIDPRLASQFVGRLRPEILQLP